jgi:enoyl-CoA hydratase/carnithine racemase
MNEDPVLLSGRGAVRTVVFNRPAARNALSREAVRRMTRILAQCGDDDEVAVLVVTGGPKVFAAGADVSEMAGMDQREAFLSDFTGCCEALGAFRKPVIAAVEGSALGGGCELVEMCDIVIASRAARFAHPEVRLATMPGAGGTQRLPRAIGKHKAMDMLLTGRAMEAEEAERAGLVSRLVPEGEALAAAEALAGEMAALSAPVLMLIKEAAGFSARASLGDGLDHERRLFNLTFGLDDRREGMRAFLEKRRPEFRNR